MKNLITLFLLSACVLFTTGCKKIPETKKTPSIIGKWETQNSVKNYYDDNDQLIHTESDNSLSIWEFTKDEVKMYSPESPEVSLTFEYKISNNGDKTILNLGGLPQEITLTESTFEMYSETTDPEDCRYEENGEQQQAAKVKEHWLYTKK